MASFLVCGIEFVFDHARRHAPMTRERDDAITLEQLDCHDAVFLDLRTRAEVNQQPLQRLTMLAIRETSDAR